MAVAFRPVAFAAAMPEAELSIIEKMNARVGIKAAPDDALVKVVDFRGIFQLPAVAFLQSSMHHVIHHRGQLSTYLRPMGAKVPAIYGESYDSALARQARG